MEWSRRAQAGAAVLVVLIALLIILYVLFLPPAERAALLGTDAATTPVVPTDRDQVLFSTVPRIEDPQEPVAKRLPGFVIRTVTQGNVLAEAGGITVSRSAFHANDADMRVHIPEETENVLLSYQVSEASGDLIVEVDGEVVHSQPVTQRQPAPIALPSRAGEIHVRFAAGPVGFRIWDSNRYVLRNVRVTGDVTGFTEAAQEQRFVLPDPEDLEAVQLELIPECQNEQGRMTIRLNGDLIFTGRPQCGVPLTLDLAPAKLVEGENVLAFSVDRGQYLVDQAAVILYPALENVEEGFTVSQEILSGAVAEQKHVLLKLSFASAGAEGVVVVNGEELSFRTHKQSFAAPITPHLRAGRNTITLVAASKDVTSLEVLLQR